MIKFLSRIFKKKEEVNLPPKPINIFIVLSPEEAEKLGRQIPNHIIVNKVREHVKQTGRSGLAGEIINAYR